MSNIKISALPTANSIDGAADFLPIVQSSVTNKISRNVLLGITGSPLGTTDTQVISNKTLGITNTITALDSSFTLQDNGDNTKQAQFQLSGITTGTTRTYTLPNASVTLASLTGTETLTNKTITAPAITGGTIDNSTITVDSIAGHTSATIVTVANLQISNGVLNTANAVTAVSIASSAIQPQALQSGTGSGWALQTWTPTPTNYSVGNGTLSARYVQTGKWVQCRVILTFGTTTTITGAVSFSLPVTAATLLTTLTPTGQYEMVVSGSQYQGYMQLQSTTTISPLTYKVSTTYIIPESLDATHPAAFATGSVLLCQFAYEAA